MGKLKDLFLMNDIEIEEDKLGAYVEEEKLGTYTVHNSDCSCTFIQTYQPVSRVKEES